MAELQECVASRRMEKKYSQLFTCMRMRKKKLTETDWKRINHLILCWICFIYTLAVCIRPGCNGTALSMFRCTVANTPIHLCIVQWRSSQLQINFSGEKTHDTGNRSLKKRFSTNVNYSETTREEKPLTHTQPAIPPHKMAGEPLITWQTATLQFHRIPNSHERYKDREGERERDRKIDCRF